MREVNLSSLDLNLLVTLKALLDERHVTRAAERVGLSQPAMSRALQRLRIMFKDPILVKGTGGMMLTARAEELKLPLQGILNEISHIITAPVVDPKEMNGEIVIATRDFEMSAILPTVITSIIEQAPGIKIRVVPLAGDDLSLLERNEIDFVVAGTDKSLATLNRATLVKDNFVCLVAPDNPAAREKLTLKKYVSMRHCLVEIGLFRVGIVDAYLSKQGHSRKIAVRVPYFNAAVAMVENSDLIITVPKRLGLLLARQNRLVMLDLPIKVKDVSIFLYWHVRNQNNPMHVWLRKCFDSLRN
ncbi:MAG: LysR family transcriptional regulator [Candidatus Obscuribacterales bacterium]|nr:LysR family transcriptional regulator [Candidatus Obscuribacterales bacterium]